MKALFTSAFFMLFLLQSLVALAGARVGKLVITSAGQMPFEVYLNGHRHMPGYADEITFPNLRAGQHHLRIVKRSQNHRHRVHIEVFDGHIFLKPNTLTKLAIDHRNRVRITEREQFRPGYGYDQHQPYHQHQPHHQQYDNHYNHDYNDYGYQNPAPQQHHWPAPAFGMPEQDFRQLKKTLENIGFDSSRLKIAKQAVAHQRLTSRQVADLMELFSFESTKLEFAKFAYDKVVDPERYFIINDEFSFTSSMDELAQYIR